MISNSSVIYHSQSYSCADIHKISMIATTEVIRVHFLAEIVLNCFCVDFEHHWEQIAEFDKSWKLLSHAHFSVKL